MLNIRGRCCQQSQVAPTDVKLLGAKGLLPLSADSKNEQQNAEE